MKKILIIDDEFIFRQGLKYMLDWEACGYSIIGEASNGQDGLDLVNALQPDIILCDIVMPIMNGVEFVKRIQAQTGPPVIMLSNYDEFDKVRTAFQYGASDYLLKNRVTKETLLKCLEQQTSHEQNTSFHLSSKTFVSHVRQILDGYASKPFTEFSNYIKNCMDVTQYQLIYMDNPALHFSTQPHFVEWIESTFNDYPVYGAYTTHHHGICLLGIPAPLPELHLSSFLGRLASLTLETSVVLSAPFTDLSLFREKAEALSDMAHFSILFDERFVFYEEEFHPLADLPPFPTETYQMYITGFLWTDACRTLLSYLNTFKNTLSVNPYQLKKFIEHTFYTTLQHARAKTKQIKELNRVEICMLKALDQACTFSQLQDGIQKAYEALGAFSSDLQTENMLITSMRHYLEEHYAQQITLYDLAEHLHMNYSYLSAYISQHTKKHFSEHLNDVRIKHAKKMLSNPKFSISRISETIGYTDQSYFGKMFKKQSGMTPLQYRNITLGKKGKHE